MGMSSVFANVAKKKVQPALSDSISASNSDVTSIFYDHVFNYMPAHLLHINHNREDLHRTFKPEHATEEEIASQMANLPNHLREQVVGNTQQLKYALLSHRWSLEKGLVNDSPGCGGEEVRTVNLSHETGEVVCYSSGTWLQAGTGRHTLHQ